MTKLRADALWRDLLQIQWPATFYDRLEPTKPEQEELAELIQTFINWAVPDEPDPGSAWWGTDVEKAYIERKRIRNLLYLEKQRVLEYPKDQIKECPKCQGSGKNYFLDYTLKERPHDSIQRELTPEEADKFFLEDWPDYASASVEECECDHCQSLGYILV